MSVKKWVVGFPDREKAKLLAQECDIDPFAALVAVGRGFDDAAELELLMSDEPVLCDPLELADIKIAAEYINNAITDGVKIAVFGDYDCDGVVATALLYDYLVSRGADVVAYIPDRIDEGYGMNNAAIDKLKQQQVSLIITVDNGIACAEEISYADTLGIRHRASSSKANLKEKFGQVSEHTVYFREAKNLNANMDEYVAKFIEDLDDKQGD